MGTLVLLTGDKLAGLAINVLAMGRDVKAPHVAQI